MREGSTSVAFIEPEVSVTSITDARSLGTAIVASGRASATARPARAKQSRAVGRIRRRRLPPARTAATVGAAGKRTT
jgi:hypothetical protein